MSAVFDQVRRIALLAFVGMCGQAMAADSSSLISGGFNAESRTARIEIARDLLADIKLLADLLPTPRPTDQRWVDDERAAIQKLTSADASSSRLMQLYESPEFQHIKLHGHLREIQNALNCVLDAKVQRRREVFCWGVASFLLGDRTLLIDGVTILHRAKRLPDDIIKRGKVGSIEGFAVIYGLYSRSIQEHVVLPYLRDDPK